MSSVPPQCVLVAARTQLAARIVVCTSLGRTGRGFSGSTPGRGFRIPKGRSGGDVMTTDDKFDHKAEELKGKAKETYGKVADDEEAETEGKAEQTKANLKQAADKVKDAFKG
jgi:uncharacterized protein YjbJ (UPF0337 family)